MTELAPDTLRVSVLGAGSYGTALASLCSARASTMLWARDPGVVEEINHHHTLERYLTGISLPASLTATNSLQDAVQHACGADEGPALLILGVPMAALAETCQALSEHLPLHRQHPVYVVRVCKGFDAKTGELPSHVTQMHLAARPWLSHGVLSGPSFALEVAQGLPVALTAASQNPALPSACVSAMHGTQARIYASDDVIGVEVGGALKNIIAIACGIGDGLGLGSNARAALITRGLSEIQHLGMALGGQAETFIGLSGLGDLVLTATGDLSRNRRVGLAIGQGESIDSIMASGLTAEGVRCAKAAREIAQRHQVDAPITEAVYQVLLEGLHPRQAVSGLLARESRCERT
ncbi:NAD(P)-dependent glycerol-3-phosphate dehydrogenase [Paenalcaligenes niemegkensis]|uniref:NAD(P)H-dependent glycerol-3-phosphate dehydrogenase n=1 Tax=Paenalcaligenes niemegkensis TaxID=2895469 RepID=UPI001EE9A5A7|nr:NAD(P)H-dependent glycerol-3-phosphate dehydrogenase [Paenalcaligenes niemegkensis]MCQ9615588.1 NAD(P)-dependent glycerol-3-phosphate dehydrogenase [Paenalcaligenes niemegkensis]